MPSSGHTFASLKSFVRDNMWSGIKEIDDRRIARAIKRGIEVVSERDWSWMLVRNFRVLTIAPYTTGTLTGSVGSASLTGSGTTWTDAMVGRFIRIDGVPDLYRIASRAGNTAITLDEPLADAPSAGGTYEILAVDYDLPDNFREAAAVIDSRVGRATDLVAVQSVEFEELMADGGTGASDVYTIATEHLGVGKQIRFWPAPQEARYYKVLYWKQPGWFAASGGAFQPFAVADGDIVDWPREHIGLLEKACLMEAAAEFKAQDWQAQASLDYSRHYQRLAGKDQPVAGPRSLHQGSVPVRRGYPRISP